MGVEGTAAAQPAGTVLELAHVQVPTAGHPPRGTSLELCQPHEGDSHTKRILGEGA